MTCKPPASRTWSWLFCQATLIFSTWSGVGASRCATSASQLPPRIMSVPRPAMFVAIVTVPGLPAWAIISASFSWNLAFRTLCLTFFLLSNSESSSDVSMEAVPTKTGALFARQSAISSAIASNFSAWLINIRSFRSRRTIGRFVGITTTSSP